MNDPLTAFFFGIYPYIAICVMVVGSILRYDRDPYSWKADSSQLLRRRGLRWGSNLFHVGVLFILFGHFFGLLTPHALYEHVISAENKQSLAMISGGIAGGLALIGLLILIWRRLADERIKATTRFMDMAILLLLFAQLMLGMLTIPQSARHPDGATMMTLALWAQHIVTFRPGAADYLTGVAPVFKAHIVLGLTIFLIFPFTRLVHMLSVPFKYLLRPGYQVVRRGRRASPLG
ncbi:MAG: respiratory nitrate reductase subunit gamma [Nitrospirota bacterium]|nr:respiratory nitrate reductase subunit gamma [Nitrospirota bacterium]